MPSSHPDIGRRALLIAAGAASPSIALAAQNIQNGSAASFDVRLFTELSQTSIPANVSTVVTSGHTVPGLGSARYNSTVETGSTRYRALSADGRWFELAEVEPNVEQFGAVPDGEIGSAKGTDNTEALTAAHLWVNEKDGRSLAYGCGPYRISAPIPIPTNYEWNIASRAQTLLIQSSNNMEHFLLVCSQRDRSNFQTRICPGRFSISGFKFSWVENQNKEQTRSIGIAFKATSDVPDGCSGFSIFNCSNENGFRLISIHPETIRQRYDFPLWGWEIYDIVNLAKTSGGLLYAGNFGRGGAPRGILRNYYDQSPLPQEPSVVLRNMNSPLLENGEFNLGSGRRIFLQGCTATKIVNTRYERCVLLGPTSDFLCIAGASDNAKIEGFEMYNCTVKAVPGAIAILIYDSRAAISGVVARNCKVDTKLYILSTEKGGEIRYNEMPIITQDGEKIPAISLYRSEESQGEAILYDNFQTIRWNLSGRVEPETHLMTRPGFITKLTARLPQPPGQPQSVCVTKNGQRVWDGAFTVSLESGAAKAFAAPGRLRDDVSVQHSFDAGDELSIVLVGPEPSMPCQIAIDLAFGRAAR